jgi:hypothetical protein
LLGAARAIARSLHYEELERAAANRQIMYDILRGEWAP